ncbi:MAG: hypothetical protein Q8P13_02095 [bacterium]|nr:hypothetical protein [bacterium]
MIDNLEFTKFVLKTKKMTPEQKNLFLEAVPNMTEEDKTNLILSLGLQNLAAIYEDVSDTEDKAALSGKDIDQEVDNFLLKRGESIDNDQIEQLRDQLKSASDRTPKPEQV